MRIKTKFLGLLVISGVAFAGSKEITQESLDTSGKISTVNENFRGLSYGKLDLNPRGVNPFSDSKYDLGELGREWRRAYIDNLFVTTINGNIVPVAATQAQQESATSTTTFVSPARQQYHPSASKAWVIFVGTGTVTSLSSYNVSSITDGGAGTYTVNFSTPFSSINYACVCTATLTSGALRTCAHDVPATVSAFPVKVKGEAFGDQDSNRVLIACFGDQ